MKKTPARKPTRTQPDRKPAKAKTPKLFVAYRTDDWTEDTFVGQEQEVRDWAAARALDYESRFTVAQIVPVEIAVPPPQYEVIWEKPK